ncbi:MAG: 3'-5' exonuclease [Bacteroidales bacterium]|nr:MAG: 3'-5' exonuclease [Bacteroidales bacterium]
MLKEIKPEEVLFLDIETVPQYPEYAQLPEDIKSFWDKKAGQLIRGDETPETLFGRSGIYAEFGKIVCISAGFVVQHDGDRFFRVKSFYGDDEKALLSGFAVMLNRFGAKPKANLCAHNGKEFDFPYISRRMLINGVGIPELLDVAGKKPWEVKFLDTMELWKFGDYKHYTSLNLLSMIFNIPSPKDDIDGSQVADVYYKEQDIERITRYCEKDALTVAQLFLRYKNEPIINPENIERVLE